jgi:hydrogenase maturation protease
MDMVIGIGNRLRKDDGIGAALVEALGSVHGAECHVVHQLTPDLAPRLSKVDRVLFVDAAMDGTETRLERVDPARGHGVGHAMTPSAFLGFAATMFDARPSAWLLAVPGCDFGIGEHISSEARSRLPEAARRIEAWLGAESATVRI